MKNDNDIQRFTILNGRSPLQIATENNYSDIVKALTE